MIFAICKTSNDCVAACISSIIERGDVPNVFENIAKGIEGPETADKAWKALREYLKSIGYTLFLTGYDINPLEEMREVNPDSLYMLMCQFGGVDHAVVCRGGDILHDPAWHKAELSGPHTTGVYIVGVIGNL